MNRRSLNKYTMYRAVWHFAGAPEQQEAREAIEAFGEAFAAFAKLTPRIRSASVEARGHASKGTTEAKLALRLDLADEVDRISGALVTYADVTENAALAAAAHVTHSMITRGPELTAVTRATNLLDLARKHAGDGTLAGYGLTLEVLGRFAKLINAFSKELGQPRSVIIQGKLARASLSTLFAAADKHLHQMDRLAPILSESHPAFVSAYRIHRRIFHQAATRRRGRHGKAIASAVESSVESTPSAAASAPQRFSDASGVRVREWETEPTEMACVY